MGNLKRKGRWRPLDIKNKEEHESVKMEGVEETHNLLAESFMDGTVEDKLELEQNNTNKSGGKSIAQKQK
jgi:hypothetical protein